MSLRVQISFRGAIVILCSLAAVVPVVILSVPFVSALARAAYESADRELRLMSESVNQDLGFQLNQIILQSRSLTQDGDIGRAVRSVLFLSRADTQLGSLAQEHKLVGGAYLLNIDQTVVTAYPDSLLKRQLPAALLSEVKNAMQPNSGNAYEKGVWARELDNGDMVQAIEGRIINPSLFFLVFTVPGVLGRPAGALVILIPLDRIDRVVASAARSPTQISVSLMDAVPTAKRDDGLVVQYSKVIWPTSLNATGDLVIRIEEPTSYRFATVKQNVVRWSGLALLLALAFGFIGYALSRALSAPFALLHRYADSFGRGVYSLVPVRSRFSDFSAMFAVFAEMAKKIEEHMEAEKARLALEMNVLRNQMSPHFLFNSLNSLSTMVDIDKKQAAEMTVKLSAMYRGILDGSKTTTWPLQREIDLISNYLDLEKMRFAERLSYSFDIPRDLMNIQVPPLILQTLVENAVKHGIAPSRNGGDVNVEIKRLSSSQIKIAVKNSGAVYQENGKSSGTGIMNTKRRLEMLWGEASSFWIGTNSSGETEVSFSIGDRYDPARG